MGLFSKSILILAVALSTPLLYRQFASDDTIKFMSNYYSNYKVIDKYLRQGASHIDQAKEFLPDSKQLQQVYEKLNKQFVQFLNPTQAPANKKDGTARTSESSSDEGKIYKMTTCPDQETPVRLWSKEELAKFNSKSGSTEFYLGFMGIVYNVSLNAQHYGPDADYNAFTGHDATRAFVTGEFIKDLHDDIRDIDEKLYTHFETWALFYNTSYQQLGLIEGAFYDSRGCPTPELVRVREIFAKLAVEKAKLAELEKSLPECNTEWNSDIKRGRVWCSPKSGGIEREWSGVPRIVDEGGSRRCVCLNLDSPEAKTYGRNLAPYPSCSFEASECALRQG